LGGCVRGVALQATNQINTLEGLGHLAQLTTLHLRENQLKTLDGLTEQMSALQYINLRCVLYWSLILLGIHYKIVLHYIKATTTLHPTTRAKRRESHEP